MKKQRKIIKWFDEVDPNANLNIDPNTPPAGDVTPPANDNVAPPANEPPAVDVNKIEGDISGIKNNLQEMLNSASKNKELHANNLVQPPVAPVQSGNLEITNFANIGLNEDQQKTIGIHVQTVVARKDAEIVGLQAKVKELEGALAVKQTDESSIIAKISGEYETTFQSAISQVTSLEEQIKHLAEQLKIKDGIIASKDNAEFLASEFKAKPWMEDLAKAQKITTREEYLKFVAPMEAREKKIWETTNRNSNSSNVFSGINALKNNLQHNQQDVKPTNAGSKAQSIVGKYLNR